MNNRRLWLAGSVIAGLGVIGYSIYYYFKRQSELIKEFTYKILDVSTTEFSAQNIRGSITIEFGNTSDIELQVEQFYVDFYINGEYVGFMEDNRQFVILPNAKTPVSFNFYINPQDIIGNVVDILAVTLNANDVVFTVTGYAKVRSGFIKVSIPVEFENTLKEILA